MNSVFILIAAIKSQRYSVTSTTKRSLNGYRRVGVRFVFKLTVTNCYKARPDPELLKLHEGEVQPGQKMLIGFEVSDANQKRALSVSDWETYVAVNAYGKNDSRSAGTASAECDRLANKPRGELSFAETERLMGCVLSRIPAMIQNQ